MSGKNLSSVAYHSHIERKVTYSNELVLYKSVPYKIV